MGTRKADDYLERYLAGDIDEQELVMALEPLMKWVFNNYTVTGVIEEDDFLQEARILLFRAIKSFDGTRKVKFSTYYIRSLKNFLCDQLRKRTSQKQIPEKLLVRQGVCLEATLANHQMDASKTDYYPEQRLIIQEKITEYLCCLSAVEKQTLIKFLTLNNIQSAEYINMSCQKNAYQRCRKKMNSYLQ